MSVRVLPQAEAEIDEAAAWYRERSELSAARFLQATAEAIDRIDSYSKFG